jgi:hypothetical protein
MSHKPGGGYGSKQHVQKPQPKIEPRSRAVDPEAVATLGVKVAWQKPPLERGAGYNAPVGPTNNLVSGPGGGREVFKSGSQHGLTTRQLPEGRDILSEFGPESPNQMK